MNTADCPTALASTKGKVMIVDDDPVTLEVAATLLEDAGYEIIRQGSALGTASAVVREEPDVLLLDVNMPGLSGDKLAGLALRSEHNKVPKVVLFSSLDSRELEQLATRCGATGTVQKTGNVTDFLQRFESAVAAPSAFDRTPRREWK